MTRRPHSYSRTLTSLSRPLCIGKVISQITIANLFGEYNIHICVMYYVYWIFVSDTSEMFKFSKALLELDIPCIRLLWKAGCLGSILSMLLSFPVKNYSNFFTMNSIMYVIMAIP